MTTTGPITPEEVGTAESNGTIMLDFNDPIDDPVEWCREVRGADGPYAYWGTIRVLNPSDPGVPVYPASIDGFRILLNDEGMGTETTSSVTMEVSREHARLYIAADVHRPDTAAFINALADDYNAAIRTPEREAD